MKWTILIVFISLILSRSFAYLAGEEEGKVFPQAIAERYVTELTKDNLVHKTFPLSKEIVLDQLDSADRLQVKGVSVDLRFESTHGESAILAINGDYFTEEGFELTEQLPGEWTLVFAEEPLNDSRKLFWNIGTSDKRVTLYLPARIDHLDLKLVSGDVDLNLAEMKRVMIKTVSGDIEGKLATKDLSLKTVSGDIELKLRDSLALIDVNTTSGDIELELLSGVLDGEIDFTSVSGDLKIDEKNYQNKLKETFGAGAGQFKIRTISGDVKIDTK